MNRYELLSRFHEGRPIQVIASSAPSKLRMVDLRGLPEPERNSRALILTAEEVKGPFNLQQGPLFRCSLIQIRADEHILVLVVHHVVSDGWSMAILYRELSALYETFSSGKASSLSDLPIQYADYAEWQRERLQDAALETQLSYWRRQLSGAPPALKLPTEYPRPPIQTFRGASVKLELSHDLHQKSSPWAVSKGATLFMTLLAAFKIQLHRYTGQNDIVVGSPIAGRNRRETEGLIGFFLNNLVLRTDLSGRPTFCDIVSRVREVALGAYAHQDIPFERLLEELRPERDLSRTPFFQVYFNMLSQDDSKPTFGNLTTERFGQAEAESKFDITLYVRDQRSGVFLTLVYNADLFENGRMAEMLRQFEQLLWQVVEHPDQSIDSYSLVTTHARKSLPDPTKGLNDDWQGAIHERCALHAKQIPQQLAVIDQWGSWSYAQLNSCSNQLAHHLIRQGIKSEEIIAIYGHRSAALVCAVLGILKAGGAFLILDPAYPASRHLNCLQQAQPRAWFELEAAGAVSPELAACIDTLPLRCRSGLSKSVASINHAFNGYPDDDPQISTSAENLAYVSFTSGSTGGPKGVLGRHGPLTHFLPWQERTFGLSAADRYTMLSGLSHDPLQRDMFTPLWFGASLFIPDPDIIGTANLARWMKEQKITFTHLVPSMLQLLTETAAADCYVPSWRYAYFVGEKLTPHDVARLRRLAPNVNCIAAYGTTETQRAVSYYFISKDETVDANLGKSAYPLGRGIDDVQLLVLSGVQRLAGVGEIGEIYLRSPHLARGYLGDEDLTQSRFLKNPFTDVASDRLYRTGDLGRYLADGNVEFAGRADRQIKLRGFRIEPREIEASLAQHPSIKEVAVVARRDSFTDGPDTHSPGTQLVAYVVLTQKGAQSTENLRNYLRQKVPEYMVPSSMVILDFLPLTPNGKLDEDSLPFPAYNAAEGTASFIAPRTATETSLAEIWSEVLKRDKVGIRDNFFDLGGHSLLAVRVVDLIGKRIGGAVRVATLFQAPTIERLALLLQKEPVANWSSMVALQPNGSKTPFFWVHGEASDAYLPRYLGPDQPLYGLRHQSEDGQPAHYKTVQDIAAHYLEEIRSVQPQGPYLLGGYCFGGLVVLEMAQRLQAQGQRIYLLVLLDPAFGKTPDGHNAAPRAATLSLLNNFRHDRHALASLRPEEKWCFVLKRTKETAVEALLFALSPSRK